MEQESEHLNEGAALRHDRAAARDSMFLQATISSSVLAAPILMRVRNLSPGGLMADYSGPLPRGEQVKVEMRGLGTVDARVAWRTDMRVGLAFDKQVDPRLARTPIGQRKQELSHVPRPTSFVRSGLR